MRKETKGRLLILIALGLSIVLALMFWNEIEYYPVAMIFALPVGLYLPVMITILLFKTFTIDFYGESLKEEK